MVNVDERIFYFWSRPVVAKNDGSVIIARKLCAAWCRIPRLVVGKGSIYGLIYFVAIYRDQARDIAGRFFFGWNRNMIESGCRNGMELWRIGVDRRKVE